MGATIAASPPDTCRDPPELIRRYRAMVRIRTFDAEAIELQRTSRRGARAPTFDHRVVAGGEAARFPAAVTADLEAPT